MESQKLDVSLCVRLSEGLFEWLKAEAKKDRRKLATFIRIKLEELRERK